MLDNIATFIVKLAIIHVYYVCFPTQATPAKSKHVLAIWEMWP